MKLTNGFYTALGTPIDKNGNLIAASLEKEIEQQIAAKAAGVLLMGSMGIEAFLKFSTYQEAVKVGIKAVKGRVPLFIGAMDTSVEKVLEKINSIGENQPVDGIVITAPFYGKANDEFALNFFTRIADRSPYPIYVYDLAVTVGYKVTMPIIDALIAHPNVKGIKTADWEMIKAIGRKYPDAEFNCLYSGLDSFDYANVLGIRMNLDGMFAATPANGKKMYECLAKDDFDGARKYLDNILLLRNTYIKYGVMRSFTYSMNLLGCEGNFHTDFDNEVSEEGKAAVAAVMKQIGEIA